MKQKRFLQTAFMLTAALLLLAACTQNELSDGSQGETLPEGKYPLTFNASIDGEAVAATPQTRGSSVDGDAASLDYIGTWVLKNSTDDKRIMIFKRDGATSTWKFYQNFGSEGQPSAPYYWGSTSESIRMRAWYFPNNNEGQIYGKTSQNASLSDSGLDYFNWSVKSDQDKNSGYENSDFLYALEWFNFSESKTLHFFHQTAKVVVHIIAGDQTPADITSDKISMTIGDSDSDNKIYLQGEWEKTDSHWSDDSSEILGRWSTWGKAKGYIIPKELGPQDITVGDKTVTSLASYEALVIPQTITAGKKLFVINIEGYAPFYYTPAADINWSTSSGSKKPGGVEFTYYITIKGSSLSVTTSQSIGWGTDGESGSGSVEIE